MDLVYEDFNGAAAYYGGQGAAEWAELEDVLHRLPLFLQASQQTGIEGRAIFDPKGTNAFLTQEAKKLGWSKIPVPKELTQFGRDWDAGKGATLAEWQFSNYPFLWNNVIRSEAVYKGKLALQGLSQAPLALVEVTKSGLFPSSNSTLNFGQARAQVEAVMKFGTFTIPIRLVGLTLPDSAEAVQAVCMEYGSRYARAPIAQSVRTMKVLWKQANKYGLRTCLFTEA